MKDRLVATLRSEIMSGQLRPRAKLTELDLSDNYGVSRSVVREALQELGHQGLVVSVPYKGSEIAYISRTEVAELLIPLRIKIEQFALRTGYKRWDTAQFSNLSDALTGMEKGVTNKNIAEFNEADMKFHSLIVSAAESVTAMSVWEAIYQRILIHFALQTGRTGALPQYLADHAHLLDTFRSGDLEASVIAIEEHIRDTNAPWLVLLEE
jgi:DNA-binding GntR family transcriptional regulator